MKIPFIKQYTTGNELVYIKDIIDNGYTTTGDGIYTKKVHEFLEKRYGTPKALLTTSGTTALEFAVRLLNLEPEDEVIVPSFTFSSTVNAILLAHKIKVVFADIEENTMNIDPEDIKKKITDKTKAIIVVHYAGVACDMDYIMQMAKDHNLKVIEDAAQAIEAKYKDRYLGTIGDFGCISFHGTKNITSGEGGALFINTNNEELFEKAEIIREKGTNRTKFIKGEVDKYTWVDIGSSYLPSDLLAAYLYAQLERVDEITQKRKEIYEKYTVMLTPLEKKGLIKLASIPHFAIHNAHIFYIILKDNKTRDELLSHLKAMDISASFHYIPLHSAPQGIKNGYKHGDLPKTENMSGRLVRLPLFPQITDEELNYVKNCINTFFQEK